MPDRIEIKDLLVRGILGVNDWEREKPQDILINVSIDTDLRSAGTSDKLDDTVNYRTISKKIIEHVEKSSRYTVEALATDVARLCLAVSGVQRVRVRVEKPGALRFARSVGVEIERTPEDFS
jgi:FolB domain-containing protein